jgi:hypothetical protein
MKAQYLTMEVQQENNSPNRRGFTDSLVKEVSQTMHREYIQQTT